MGDQAYRIDLSLLAMQSFFWHKEEMDSAYYQYSQYSAEEVLEKLGSSKEGLQRSEVEKRRARYGENTIEGKKRISLWAVLARQCLNPLAIILFVAAVAKASLGSYVEGGTIGVTVFFMVAIAFFQEAKAERSLEALKQLSPDRCRIQRDGLLQEVDAKELVFGDILFLEPGDKVPADARLLSINGLQVDESSLTGESTPITKIVEKIPQEALLADQKNMVFAPSIVLSGKGVAVVTATGMHSALGKIAAEMSRIEQEKTPLQISIGRFSKAMMVLVAGFVSLLGVLGWIQGMAIRELLLFSIAVAVAAIPEGLPAVVTVVLSIGVQIMARKKALIRHLLAVETLGSTSVICTDKTGTLTINQLKVVQHEVSGHLEDLLDVAFFCQDAKKTPEGWKGDPVELALIAWAEKERPDVAKGEKLAEIPFSSENGMMAALMAFSKGNELLIKGAPEILLERASNSKSEWKNIVEKMSAQGLKVLAAAKKPWKNNDFTLDDVQE